MTWLSVLPRLKLLSVSLFPQPKVVLSPQLPWQKNKDEHATKFGQLSPGLWMHGDRWTSLDTAANSTRRTGSSRLETRTWDSDILLKLGLEYIYWVSRKEWVHLHLNYWLTFWIEQKKFALAWLGLDSQVPRSSCEVSWGTWLGLDGCMDAWPSWRQI